MAGELVQTPTNGALDWSDFVAQMERVKKGTIPLEFTTLTAGSTAPKIIAGSWVEVNGNMYRFNSQETATGWSGIGSPALVYMKVVVAGTSITAEFTTSAPTYSDLKQGWYNGNDRYILWLYKDSGDNYTLMKTEPEITRKGWPSFHVTKGGPGGPQNNITGTQKITWPVEIFDTNNNFASNKFTPTVEGKYLLTLALRWSGITDGDILEMYLYKNGSEILTHIEKAGTLYANTRLTVIVDANGSTDYFEIFALNNSRDTSDIYGNTELTYWMGSRIAT